MALLEIRNLTVHLPAPDGPVAVVDDLSLDLDAGECLGLVGESGSGKTMSSMALLNLLPAGATRSGSIRLDGDELTAMSRAQMRSVRGRRIAMVMQDPQAALNPYRRIAAQMIEAPMLHLQLDKSTALARAADSLLDVGLASSADAAAELLTRYPHELSGGQRQRVTIAMALLCRPDVLILDEPTTALDVTVQERILTLLARLREQHQIAMLLITHDLAVVAGLCDQVAVLYAGRLLEAGPAEQVFAQPRHPYTRGLLAAIPSMEQKAGHRLQAIPGQPPVVAERKPGCPFAPRCADVLPRCAREHPALLRRGSHRAACHLETTA